MADSVQPSDSPPHSICGFTLSNRSFPVTADQPRLLCGRPRKRRLALSARTASLFGRAHDKSARFGVQIFGEHREGCVNY